MGILIRLLLFFGACLQTSSSALPSCFENKKDLGELTPIDPNAVVGQTFTFTCSATQERLKSRHLYFAIDDKRIRTCDDSFSGDSCEGHIVEVNDTTARLSITHMRREYDEKIICCMSSKKPKNRCVSCQHLKVGYFPISQNVSYVEVMNWERLDFGWVQNIDNPFTTTYAGKWRRCFSNFTCKSEWQNCTYNRTPNCSVILDQSKDVHTSVWFELQVTGENIIGRKSGTIRTVAPFDLVRPNPVRDLKNTGRSSNTVSLQWMSPKPGKLLEYVIQYKCQWDNKFKNASHTSNSSIITKQITGLTPYSNYTFHTRVHPVEGGRYSEQQTIQLLTEESVPAEVPEVTDGCFELTEERNGKRDVVLHWKFIPEEMRNGIIISYDIQYTCLTCENKSDRNLEIKEVKQHKSYFKFANLSSEDSYSFFVNARTRVGQNKNSVKPVHIPASKDVPGVVRNFTVIAYNESHVRCGWNLAEGATYTLFFCKFAPNYTCLGNENVNWVHVKPNKSSTIVSLPNSNYRPYMFGISKHTSSPEASTGIRWTKNIYIMKLPPEGPDIVENKEITENSVKLKIVVLPSLQEEAYVYSFLVNYCKQDHHNNCIEGTSVNQTAPREEGINTVTMYKLTGLSPSSTYQLIVCSLTGEPQIMCDSTKMITITTTAPKFPLWLIIILVIVGVCVSSFLICGLYVLRKRLPGWKQKLSSWCDSAKINMPDRAAQFEEDNIEAEQRTARQRKRKKIRQTVECEEAQIGPNGEKIAKIPPFSHEPDDTASGSEYENETEDQTGSEEEDDNYQRVRHVDHMIAMDMLGDMEGFNLEDDDNEYNAYEEDDGYTSTDLKYDPVCDLEGIELSNGQLRRADSSSGNYSNSGSLVGAQIIEMANEENNADSHESSFESTQSIEDYSKITCGSPESKLNESQPLLFDMTSIAEPTEDVLQFTITGEDENLIVENKNKRDPPLQKQKKKKREPKVVFVKPNEHLKHESLCFDRPSDC